MEYTFDQIFAADPKETDKVAANALVIIFAPDDTTRTPLALRTNDGRPMANPVQTNAHGFGGVFIADIQRVAWAGGEFSGFFTSYDGMAAESRLNRVASEESAVSSAISAGEAEGARIAAEAAAGMAADAAAAEVQEQLGATVAEATAAREAAELAASLVEAPTDVVTAGLVGNPETLTGRVLSAAIGLQTEGKLDSSIAASSYAPLPPGASFEPGGVRRTRVSISGPEQTIAAAAINKQQRWAYTFPAKIVRARLRMANRNLATNTALTTPLTVTDVYVGTPQLAPASSQRWNGSFLENPPRKIWNGFTVPTDGTDAVTEWAELPGGLPGQPVLFSYGVTSTNTGNGYAAGTRQINNYDGGAATPGGKGPGGGFVGQQNIVGDVRIEVEFVGPVTIGFFVGDSITQGFGEGDVTSGGTGTQASERWPDAAGLIGGFFAMNGAVHGTSPILFSTSTNYVWSRWGFGEVSTPDFAMLAIGTNALDDNPTTSVTTIQTQYASIVKNCRDLGIRKVHATTIMPRGWRAYTGVLNANATAGATSILALTNPGNVPIIIDSGSQQERKTTTAVTPVGDGSYTLTIDTALARDHTNRTNAAKVIFAWGREYSRMLFNDWLRQVPAGITTCIDFDTEMAERIYSPEPNWNYASKDAVHLLRAGYQRMATIVAALKL